MSDGYSLVDRELGLTPLELDEGDRMELLLWILRCLGGGGEEASGPWPKH